MSLLPLAYSRLQEIAWSGRKPYPLLLTWYVTARCNLSCDYCFQQENSLFLGSHQEMTTEQAFRFIEDLAGYYRRYPLKPLMIISGGEPLLRKDIFLICNHFEKKGLRYRFASNLSLTDEALIERLAKLRPEALGVSFGFDSGSFSRNGKPEARFDVVAKNIEYYRSLNKTVPIKICCTITGRNQKLLSKIPRLVSRWQASLNICHLQFLTQEEKDRYHQTVLNVLGSGVNPATGYVSFFDESTVNDIIIEISRIRKAAKEHNVRLQFIPNLSEKDLKSYYLRGKQRSLSGLRCASNYYELRIAPDGGIYPCLQYRYGNIKHSSWQEVLTSPSAQLFREAMSKNNILPGCLYCAKKNLYRAK